MSRARLQIVPQRTSRCYSRRGANIPGATGMVSGSQESHLPTPGARRDGRGQSPRARVQPASGVERLMWPLPEANDTPPLLRSKVYPPRPPPRPSCAPGCSVVSRPRGGSAHVNFRARRRWQDHAIGHLARGPAAPGGLGRPRFRRWRAHHLCALSGGGCPADRTELRPCHIGATALAAAPARRLPRRHPARRASRPAGGVDSRPRRLPCDPGRHDP